MPAYTFQRSLLYSEADGALVRNATGGQLLSNEGVAQTVYDLVDNPLAGLTSGDDGVVPPFKADIPTGVVSFGATALPVISVEAQAAGLEATDAATAAAAAQAAAEAAALAAEVAAANTQGVPDAAADAAIDRALADGRLPSLPLPQTEVAGLVVALDGKAPLLAPLGHTNNPVIVVTGNEPRPTGLPFPICDWLGEVSPVNAIPGDRIEIVEAPEPVYEQHWDGANGTGIANWRAKTNASSLVHDLTRDAGGGTTAGSLKWTATAAGNTTVEYASTVPVSASTSITYKVWVYNGDTVSRMARVGVDQYNGGTYISGSTVQTSSTPVPAGSWVEMTFTTTTVATATAVRQFVVFEAATLGATFNVDRVTVV